MGKKRPVADIAGDVGKINATSLFASLTQECRQIGPRFKFDAKQRHQGQDASFAIIVNAR